MDLLAEVLGDGLDIAGVVRGSGQGLEGGEVEFPGFVVVGGRVVGQELHPIAAAALGFEEGLGGGVGGEDRGGHPELGAHIGDGGAAGHIERGQGRAGVLKDLADVALRAEAAQHGEDDILGRDAGVEPASQANAHRLGPSDVVGSAAHRDGHVDAAGANGDHPDAAAGGGVGIRANQRLARLAEALEVELVADAISGLGIDDAILARHRLQVVVVIGILEADLHGVVVHVAHRELGLDAVDAHTLELEIGHRPGGILGEGLVNANSHLFPNDGVSGNEVGAKNLLCNVHAISNLTNLRLSFTPRAFPASGA